MRQILGQLSPLLLRRLLLPARSLLRLLRPQKSRPPRRSSLPPFQYVALLGIPPAPRKVHGPQRHGRNSASIRTKTGRALGPEESLSQERRSLLPFSFLQRPRRSHRTHRRSPLRL